MKDSVDGCGVRYHRCLGPALHKIGSHGMGPFCHLGFLLGTGFQSIFQIWPAATSWSTAAGVPQPSVGAQLWLVAVPSWSQGGFQLECWNVQFCHGSLQSLVNHVGVESCWALSCGESPLWAAEARLRTGHGSASLQERWVWGALLGPGCKPWACSSPQLPLSWRGEGLPQWAVVTVPKGEHSAREQDGLHWGGRLVTLILGKLCRGC